MVWGFKSESVGAALSTGLSRSPAITPAQPRRLVHAYQKTAARCSSVCPAPTVANPAVGLPSPFAAVAGHCHFRVRDHEHRHRRGGLNLARGKPIESSAIRRLRAPDVLHREGVRVAGTDRRAQGKVLLRHSRDRLVISTR